MAGHKIANNSGKFADLKIQTAIFPGRNAQRIFIQPNGGAVIARIEPAIESRLGKEINLFAELRVEKKRETRIEKIVDPAVDQYRRWLLEMVNFKINRSA